MAAHKGQINYDLRFNVDTASLKSLKTELIDIQKLTAQDIMAKNPQLNLKEARSQLIDIKRDAAEVQNALEKAFNANLGSINVTKFDNELKKANINLSSVYKNFQAMGATGIQAFQQLSSSVLTSNLQLRQTHKILDNIGQTMFNTAKWGIASSVFNNMTSSVQQAWNYTKGLDKSLNDIMIVTTKSADEMDRFARQANAAAQKLGASTRDYTDAALIYYQQGLNDTETAARAEVTVKAANVTGQSGDAVSEQLTAIWNGYKVAAEETELYIDKVAKVAATTAADLNEMATAMSKVASAANSAGVDIDHLNGMLSTVISVTREAPETIGTSFRTIFARLGDLKLGGTDEEGVNLGNVSGKLHQLGVEVLDQNNNMRDMQDIITDVAAKWQDWTQAQRQAAAVAMAGKMQYSRLIALFDNWDMYTNALNESVNAQGELQHEQDIYMESTQAHLQQLSTAWQRVYDAAIDNGKANGIIDLLTGMTNGVANWVEAMGGGTQVLAVLGSLGTKVFSKQIAGALNTTISNFEAAKFNAQQLKNQIAELQLLDEKSDYKDIGTHTRAVEREKLSQYTGNMSKEQIEQANQLIDAYAQARSEIQQYEVEAGESINYIKETMSGIKDFSLDNLLNNGKTEKDTALKEEAWEKFSVQQEENKVSLEKLGLQYEEIIKLRKEIESETFLEDEEADWEELNRAVEDYTNKLKQLAQRGDISKDTREDIQKAIQGLDGLDMSTETSQKNGKNVRNVEIAAENTQALEKANKAVSKTYEEMSDKGNKVSKMMTDMGYDLDILKIKEDSTKDAYEEYMKSIERENAINTLTRAVGAAGQLASALMVLTNIGNIWSNEDITLGEKVLQTMMSLGTTIPMVVSGLKTLKESWSIVNTFLKAFGESFVKTSAKIGTQVTGNAVLVASNKTVEQSEKDVNKAKNEGLIATEEKIASNGAEIISNEALVASNETVAVSSGSVVTGVAATGVAAEGAAVGMETAGGAATTLGASLGALVAPVAIAVAAIAAIAGVGYLIYRTVNKDKLELEALDKEIEESKKVASEAAEAYTELNNTFSNYKSAYDSISTLTEGTLEFYQAIVKANEEAQKLIDTLGLVAGADYQIDSNGLIKIDEKALSDKMFKEYQKQQQANLKVTTDTFIRDEKKRQQEEEKLTKQFQKGVSKKTTEALKEQIENQSDGKNIVSNIGDIDYKTAKSILDDFKINKESHSKNIEQVSEGFSVLSANIINFKDLEIPITDEIAKIYDEIQLNDAERKAQYTQVGAQAITAYANQKQQDKYNTLPEQLKNQVATDIGEQISKDTYKRQEEGKSGRNVTNTFEQAAGLWYQSNSTGGKIAKGIMNVLPGGILQNAIISGIGANAVKEQQNYNQTQAIPKDIIKEQLNNRVKTMQTNLANANTAGFDKNSSGKYIAQAQYQAEFNDKVDTNLLNQMTGEELQFAIDNSNKLKEVVNATGLSVDEYINKIQASQGPLDEFGRSHERIIADLQDYKSELENAAKELDVSTKTMDLYGDAVLNADKDLKKKDGTTANSIKQMAKFNKAYNESIKAYEDNKDALNDYVDSIKNGLVPSLESAEGAAAVAESLEEMGIVLDGNQLADNIDLVNQLLTGTEEDAKAAYDELKKLSYVNILQGLDVAPEILNKLKGGVQGFADYLATVEPGKPLEKSYANSLRKMINDSQMTKKQITELLSNLKIQSPNMDAHVKEHTKKSKPEVRKIHYKGSMPDLSNVTGKGKNKKAASISVNYTVTETIEGQKFKYYTLGKGTSFVSSDSGGGSTGSFARSPSNNSSSGGGGGSGSSEPKTVDPLKEQADRYHKIDTQIKKVDNNLKKLQSQQDKFIGAALLDNLNKQWEELNKQVQNYNEKLRIARGEQAELRNQLASQGVAFNADGTINNYMQAFQAQLNRVNGLIDQYNHLSAEQQEQWDKAKTIDNAKEQFNKFKENMDRYDTLVSDFIPGLEQSIQDSIDKQIEINIKKFNYEVEVTLDMSEAERQWNDWKRRVLDRINEKDILGNAAARLEDFSSYYREDNTGGIQVQTRHLEDLLDELERMDQGLDNVYGNNRAKALEDLKNYYEQLMDDLEGVMELQDEIHEKYLDEMDKVQEAFDKQLDTLELMNDTIEHDMKLIQMTMGDKAYTQLNKYYEKQQENYSKQVDFQRQQTQFWKEQMETLEKGSDEWEKATENWKNSLKEWQSAIENALENIREKFENTLNEIFEKLNDKVTSGLGLDYVAEQWDLIDKKSESYLDTINALQGINNIESKYLESINDSTNTAAQKKLKKAMDAELENLRSRDKITQADLERAEKKYQLTLAQIALEEAQQNKSQLRLRRDSQGNYTYQYAADEDAVREAQNNLGNLYSDLYNFDKEQYVSTLEEIQDIYTEYQEKMHEAALINDPEERAQRELLIQEYYGELINGLTERNELQKLNLHESAFQDLAYLYDKDLESFTKLTEEEKDLIMEDLIPQWESGVQHMVDVFAGEGGFEEVTKRALQEIAAATAEYDEDLYTLADDAGVAFDDICYGIDETLDFTEQLIEDNNELIDSYKRELDAVHKVVDEVDALVKKYNEAKTAAEKATEAAYKYWQEQQRQAQQKAAASNTTSSGASGSGANAGSGGGGAGSGNGRIDVGDVVTYKGGGYYSTSYGGGYGNRGPGGQVTVTIVKDDGRPYPIHVTSSNSAYGWLRKDQLSGYDTGGYTGDWEGGADNGRLALLHQKELVLNANDTQNLLDTVQIMRNLASLLGNNVLSRLAGMTPGKVEGLNNDSQDLEQNVHIDAHFPNVKDSKEIEDALNNLVNSASQRIYENR